MTLVRAIGFHWHAVQRDLLALGFRAVDMFTPRLTAGELLSIIVASPSTSALRYSFDGGWSLTDHLIATTHEQSLGLVQQQRLPRPGVSERAVVPPKRTSIDGQPADVLSIADFEARRAQLIKKRRVHG